MNTYQLFMGRDIPAGGYVDDYELNEFLEKVNDIVDGYTLTDALGVWHGQPEDAFVLTIAAPKDAVLQVANTYKGLFKQLAVGLVELPAMEFV